MKISFFVFLLLLLNTTACHRRQSSPALSSGTDFGTGKAGRVTVGNGGDDDPLRDSAWFLGPRKIRVCIENGTAISSSTLRKHIDEAFGIWREYLQRKRVNLPAFHPERAGLAESFLLQLNHEHVACKDGYDLRLFFGPTEDVDLNFERVRRFPGKSAFSVRREYDEKIGWGGGDVWLSSPARLKAELQTPIAQRIWIVGHLVHELGHILGCGHIPGTMMAEDFITRIDSLMRDWKNEPENETTYRRVNYRLMPDKQSQLLVCRDCPFEGGNGIDYTNWNYFYLLVPQALRQTERFWGVYHLELRRRAAEAPMELVFSPQSDRSYEKIFPIEHLVSLSHRQGDVPVFKVSVRPDPSKPFQITASYSSVLVEEGTIAVPEYPDKPLKVRVVRNSSHGQLALEVSEDTASEWPWLVREEIPLRAE